MNDSTRKIKPFLIVLAGMTVRLDLPVLPPSVEARLLADYVHFVASPTLPAGGEAAAELRIAIAVEEGPPFMQPAAGERTWRIETWRAGARLCYRSYCEEGWLDLAAGEGRLVLRPQGQIENYLRLAAARLALAHGGLLLHASGVIAGGYGYAFFGRSGAGKSTVAGLAPAGSTVLSDDLVLLRLQAEGAWLYGVPFCGEALDAPRANAAAPLAGLFALEQWPQHTLASLSPPVAAAQLLAAAPFVAGDAAALRQAAAVCTALAEIGCVQRLRFAPDPGFWPLVTGSC